MCAFDSIVWYVVYILYLVMFNAVFNATIWIQVYMPLAFFETKHLLACIQTHMNILRHRKKKYTQTFFIVRGFFSDAISCAPSTRIPFFNCTNNLGHKNNRRLQKHLLPPLRKTKNEINTHKMQWEKKNTLKMKLKQKNWIIEQRRELQHFASLDIFNIFSTQSAYHNSNRVSNPKTFSNQFFFSFQGFSNAAKWNAFFEN